MSTRTEHVMMAELQRAMNEDLPVTIHTTAGRVAGTVIYADVFVVRVIDDQDTSTLVSVQEIVSITVSG